MDRTIEPRVLKGFRDFLPKEEARRSAMLRTIAQAFETCGFAPLQTPAIEYLDILAGKYGDEGEKLLYQFRDHGERDVALRYDLTVPLARVVSLHRDLPRPFRRYQIGTVWRAEKPAHGRFREFVQCDADIVGSSSPLADADCIAAVVLAFKALEIQRFKVRLGHRGVLNALLESLQIVDPSTQVDTLRALDRLDKIGDEAVIAILSEHPGVGLERGTAIVQAIREGETGERLASLGFTVGGGAAYRHLRMVSDALENMGLGDHVTWDLSIARGLDYYTGTVFETTLLDLPSVGSVASGGRYDGLLRMFGMPEVPAVGISIGIDRLFSALQEMGRLPDAPVGPVAVVCPVGEEALPRSLHVLADLRAAGIASEVVPDPSWRLKKALQYAAHRGARFALIAGEAEVASGTVTVKDLGRGEQRAWPVSDVVREVRKALSAGEGGRADG